MKCPMDEATLVIAERRGIEIDYCPECRGVWLDRGELDRLIAQSEAEEVSRPSNEPTGKSPKKKGGFLSEIFEFGG